MTTRLVNGKLALVNGKPFLMTVGTGLPASGMTSLSAVPLATTNPLSAFTLQRKAGTIYGDVPFEFTFTGQLSPSVQGRVKDASGAVSKDWTTLTHVTTVGNRVIGYVEGVKQGISLTREFRDATQPNNTATNAADSKKFGIGIVWGKHGQSQMRNSYNYGFNDPTGAGDGEYDHSFTAAARARYSMYEYSGFTGAASTGRLITARLLAQRLEQFYGYPVPVCVVPIAVNSTDIADWNDVGGFLDVFWKNSGTADGNFGFSSPKNTCPGGDFELISFAQGEGSAGYSRAAYLAAQEKLDQFCLSYLAQFGRDASTFTLLTSMLGVYGAGNVDSAETIRAAQLDLDTTGRPGARLGCSCIDLDPEIDGNSDNLHFENSPGFPFQKWFLLRHVQSAYKALGLSTFDGVGPRITGWSRAGMVVTLTVDLNGGSSLMVKNSGSAITGFYANTVAADFSGVDIPVTAAIVNNGTKIAVTYPNGTTNFGGLKHMGGKIGTRQSYHPNVSNMIYNDVSYPEGATGPDAIVGTPLLPTPDAIVVT